MRKTVREILTMVRKAGGSDVWLSQGGRHARVHFTTMAGRKTLLLIHRGERISSRYLAMIRSQLRRKS